jgi:hypothetical protein
MNKDEMRMFHCRFNGSWPKLSTQTLETFLQMSDFIFCSSLENRRLWGIFVTKVAGKALRTPGSPVVAANCNGGAMVDFRIAATRFLYSCNN